MRRFNVLVATCSIAELTCALPSETLCHGLEKLDGKVDVLAGTGGSFDGGPLEVLTGEPWFPHLLDSKSVAINGEIGALICLHWVVRVKGATGSVCGGDDDASLARTRATLRPCAASSFPQKAPSNHQASRHHDSSSTCSLNGTPWPLVSQHLRQIVVPLLYDCHGA